MAPRPARLPHPKPTNIKPKDSRYERGTTGGQVNALTGVANRREFEDVLVRVFKDSARSRQPVALMMMDIDKFKTINDSFGHDVGDAVLRALSGVLANSAQEIGTVARFGGDEFAWILPNTDESVAMEQSKQLHRLVSELVFDFPMTISIGISVQEANVCIPHTTALKRADQALYAAKRAGRNTTAVWPQTPLDVVERLKLQVRDWIPFLPVHH